MTIAPDSALILVDLQNDFLPGGALAVPEGDLVIPVANELVQKFPLVVATQDWHPPGHKSFAASHANQEVGALIELHGLPQVLWPVHCVQNTPGAELAAGLDRSRIGHVTRKGTDAEIDSYSGFFDNGHRKATDLADYLRGRGVTDLYVMGLATDYCVKFTVLDGLKLGFTVHLVEAGCRGVNLKPGDSQAAIEAMRQAGAILEPSISSSAQKSRPS
jgi:nicotinamidase/pyrazinamidase